MPPRSMYCTHAEPVTRSKHALQHTAIVGPVLSQDECSVRRRNEMLCRDGWECTASVHLYWWHWLVRTYGYSVLSISFPTPLWRVDCLHRVTFLSLTVCIITWALLGRIWVHIVSLCLQDPLSNLRALFSVSKWTSQVLHENKNAGRHLQEKSHSNLKNTAEEIEMYFCNFVASYVFIGTFICDKTKW